MQANNKHLFSFLVHRKIKKLLKTKGLTEQQFEVIVLCKYILNRSCRPTYIKDIQVIVFNASWIAYELVESIEGIGYISIYKRPQKWAGRAKIELSLTPLGNELLEVVKLFSESGIACIKHQLDNERSLVNTPVKRKKVKAG